MGVAGYSGVVALHTAFVTTAGEPASICDACAAAPYERHDGLVGVKAPSKLCGASSRTQLLPHGRCHHCVWQHRVMAPTRPHLWVLYAVAFLQELRRPNGEGVQFLFTVGDLRLIVLMQTQRNSLASYTCGRKTRNRRLAYNKSRSPAHRAAQCKHLMMFGWLTQCSLPPARPGGGPWHPLSPLRVGFL